MWFMGYFGYACLSHVLFPAAADHSRGPPHTLHCCRLQSVQSSFFLLSSSSSIPHCPSSSLLRILVSLPDLLPRPYLLSSSPPHLPPHFSHLPQPFPTSSVSPLTSSSPIFPIAVSYSIPLSLLVFFSLFIVSYVL